MIDPGVVILWGLRVPVPPYRGTPLPNGERCPLRECGHVCRYDLTVRKGQVDGRCLTKATALRAEAAAA